MILRFREKDGKTGARLTLGEKPVPDGSFLYRDGRYIRGGVLGAIPAFAAHRHANQTLKHTGVNSGATAFAFTTQGRVTFNQPITAATDTNIGTLNLSSGVITDSSGAISFGDENLTSTGIITGNSFITAQNIGVAADADLLQLASGALTVNGNMGVGVAPDINYKLYMVSSKTNVATFGFVTSLDSIQTSSGAYNSGGMSFISYSSGTANNNGYLAGIQTLTINRKTGGAKTTNLYGIQNSYGNIGGSPLTTTTAGIYSRLYKSSGTITNAYDIYVEVPSGSSTVTNEWCIYSNHDAPSNLVGGLYVDADSKYLKFGADQDSGITDDGSDMIFDADLNAVTGRSFVFENGDFGIGVTPSSYFVEIEKNQNAGTICRIRNYTAGSSAYSAILTTTNSCSGGVYAYDDGYSNTEAADKIALYGNAQTTGVAIAAVSSVGKIEFYTNGFTSSNKRMIIDSTGDVKIGTSTNYLEVEPDGELVFAGESRIKWTKITANSITLSNGTSSETVTDLQTCNDGNVYQLTEAAGTPGMLLIIDFVSVTAFNWIQIFATYHGSSTHALEWELYNWSTTAWDHWSASFNEYSNSGTIFANRSVLVPDDTNYIGTGVDAGKVRVRLSHPMGGVASHDAWIDCVALYQ